ncbi:MAG TPA: hypothetical protein PLN38_07515 [Chitinophagales bacterium]|jgi:hypothetical protein|nr:hypothetical protein [Chitinophagales bacterium]
MKTYREGEFVVINGRKTKILKVYTDKAFGDKLMYRVKVPQYSNIKNSPLTTAIRTVDENTNELRPLQSSDYIMEKGGLTSSFNYTIGGL